MSQRNNPQGTRGQGPHSQESGFAYIMALFMILLVFAASSAAILDLRTDRRRQREDEMIWRGNQYVRAIRLYYRKTGKYPQNLDDLQKGLPELHFLRLSAYKDPVNTDDGAWRFIYVNSAGQIIGSVKYASLQQMALMDLNGGQDANRIWPFRYVVAVRFSSRARHRILLARRARNPARVRRISAARTVPRLPIQGRDRIPLQRSPARMRSSSPQAPQSGASVFGSPVAQQPTGPVDGPVIGGFLTGVGSTVDHPSVRVYDGATNYNQWEFIWNPIEDQARAVQQGVGQSQGILPGLLGPGSPGGLQGQPGASRTRNARLWRRCRSRLDRSPNPLSEPLT